jgi:hypothetical protein
MALFGPFLTDFAKNGLENASKLSISRAFMCPDKTKKGTFFDPFLVVRFGPSSPGRKSCFRGQLQLIAPSESP